MPSVTGNDLKIYQPTTRAVDFTTATIGGPISAGPTEITGGTIGEMAFTMASSAPGGGAKTQYWKFFYKNNNATNSITSAVVFLRNALAVVVTPGTIGFTSTSTSDDNTRQATAVGIDSPGGNPVQEVVTLNGITQANGVLTWGQVDRVVTSLVASGALQATSGDLTTKVGAQALGIVPASYYSATGEITFGLVGSLGDSTTTTNASTAPAGITFGRQSTFATGQAIASGGTLAATNVQGIWASWVLREQAKPSADVQMVFTIQGNAA